MNGLPISTTDARGEAIVSNRHDRHATAMSIRRNRRGSDAGCFNLGDAFRNPRSEYAASGSRHQHVVFQPAAAGVAELLDLRPVVEPLVPVLGSPLIDECRNEVEAGLDSEDEAGFERAGEAQIAEAELSAPLVPGAVTDDVLADVLQVVHVQAHHVAQAV